MKNKILSFFFLLNVLSAFSQKEHAQDFEKLWKEIHLLEKDKDLEHATWGMCVMKSGTDSQLVCRNCKAALIPASTLKILTTGAALSILGPRYRYTTLIQYDGILDTVKGILKGNIYIKGSGDPSLGSEYFVDKKDTTSLTDKWAVLLKQKGIKSIIGSVIADASAFEDEMIPSTWIWGDMGNYYGAGACGLSFGDNKYTVYFQSPSKVGDTTTIVRMNPLIPGLQLLNGVIAGGAKDNAYIFGAPYSYQRYVNGTIPAGRNNYDVDGSIPDPAWFCAFSLLNSLKKVGVKVDGEASSVRQLKLLNKYKANTRKNLYSHYSPTLENIVYYTNLKSNNLYAESLLKTIAFVKNGFGEENAGIEIVTSYWASKGVDTNGLYMNDGCGLSRANVISTEAETEVLNRIQADSLIFKPFFKSLPVAGKSGSLGSLGDGTSAENNLRAKSGYITRARSYAGYVKSKKGELLVFSLIINNYDCTPAEVKKKMEKLMVSLSEE